MRLSVIIPVYNECETIERVIRRVLSCDITQLELVIVDDASNDGTADILRSLSEKLQLTVLHHSTNKGKGAAIRTAQQHFTGDVIVIQDADMEYDPGELPRLYRLIADDRAEAVYGSRYSGTEILVDSFWHYYGNRFLTFLSNFLTNLHLTDMETCYKMIRGDIFRSMKLECNRFGIEPEITAKLARKKVRIYEVPISYEPRRYHAGKKIGWKDGVAAIWFILKYNLFSRS